MMMSVNVSPEIILATSISAASLVIIDLYLENDYNDTLSI